MRFGIDFGANLVPFWLDFCVLGVSSGALGPSWGRLGDVRGRLAASTRGSNFLNDFGIDFLMILASIWQPSSAQLGPRSRLKSAKNLTRGLPGGVSETTVYPNSFPEASASICSRFLMCFLSIFGHFLVDFWLNFGGIWSIVSRFSH